MDMTLVKWMKTFLLFTMMELICGCSEKVFYQNYSTYTAGDDGKCSPIDHANRGNIVINTGLNYIKAGVPYDQQKFRIKSINYIYNTFEFNSALRSKKSITVECTNGYLLYIEYGSFGILTLPKDGDENKCNNTLFYNLQNTK